MNILENITKNQRVFTIWKLPSISRKILEIWCDYISDLCLIRHVGSIKPEVSNVSGEGEMEAVGGLGLLDVGRAEQRYPLVNVHIAIENGPIEIVIDTIGKLT